MAFIQTIEYHTSKIDEIQKLAEDFRARRDASAPDPVKFMVAKDRDREDVYVTIVQFASYEDAMRNSEREDTSEFAQRLAALCDGPPTFRNLDVVVDEGSG